jgi:N-terminal acetyltransferase B complex non-catalytic subunit
MSSPRSLSFFSILPDMTFMGLEQALKALALVRSQKVEEALVVCDEVLAAKPTNDAVLSAMMHVLRGLGRRL